MANINYNKLKREIQTQKGLLSEIKENRLPDTSEMADKALNQYLKNLNLSKEEVKNYVVNDTSLFLKELLQCETEIYKEKTADIYRNFLNYYLENHHNRLANPYKEMEKLINHSSAKVNDSNLEVMGNTIRDLYPIIRHVVSSENQSKKSRVGHSLENHLENIFELLKIPYESQVDIDDSIIDFVLPNKRLLDDMPQNCLFLASQTTLKDRFRLSLSKISKKHSHVRRYIVTASGLGIITSRDVDDLTTEKIRAIKNKDFYLVVFKEVKDQKFKDVSNVISYEEFISDEVRMFLERWQRSMHV